MFRLVRQWTDDQESSEILQGMGSHCDYLDVQYQSCYYSRGRCASQDQLGRCPMEVQFPDSSASSDPNLEMTLTLYSLYMIARSLKEGSAPAVLSDPRLVDAHGCFPKLPRVRAHAILNFQRNFPFTLVDENSSNLIFSLLVAPPLGVPVIVPNTNLPGSPCAGSADRAFSIAFSLPIATFFAC